MNLVQLKGFYRLIKSTDELELPSISFLKWFHGIFIKGAGGFYVHIWKSVTSALFMNCQCIIALSYVMWPIGVKNLILKDSIFFSLCLPRPSKSYIFCVGFRFFTITTLIIKGLESRCHKLTELSYHHRGRLTLLRPDYLWCLPKKQSIIVTC